MAASKDSIVIAPNPVHWGNAVSASATAKPGSWIHAEAFQGDELVYAQYVRGPVGTLVFGPTPAADESQPGSGRVEVGYWAKNGSFRPTAVAKIEVLPQ